MSASVTSASMERRAARRFIRCEIKRNGSLDWSGFYGFEPYAAFEFFGAPCGREAGRVSSRGYDMMMGKKRTEAHMARKFPILGVIGFIAPFIIAAVPIGPAMGADGTGSPSCAASRPRRCRWRIGARGP